MKALVMNPIQISLGEPTLSQENPAGLTAKIRTIIPGYDQLSADEIRSDMLLFPESPVLTSSRRLVVLIPRGDFAEDILVRRIWRLASASGLGVLYLTLCPDEEYIPHYRRRLTNLAMMTSDNKLRACANVISENNWGDVVKRIQQPGDLLVCMTNHQVAQNLIKRRKLGEKLIQISKAPVYMLGGIKIGPTPEWEFAFKEVLAWVASLILIITFFGLQASIDHSTSGLLSNILIGLSIVAEFVLLLKINDSLR